MQMALFSILVCSLHTYLREIAIVGVKRKRLESVLERVWALNFAFGLELARVGVESAHGPASFQHSAVAVIYAGTTTKAVTTSI